MAASILVTSYVFASLEDEAILKRYILVILVKGVVAYTQIRRCVLNFCQTDCAEAYEQTHKRTSSCTGGQTAGGTFRWTDGKWKKTERVASPEIYQCTVTLKSPKIIHVGRFLLIV